MADIADAAALGVMFLFFVLGATVPYAVVRHCAGSANLFKYPYLCVAGFEFFLQFFLAPERVNTSSRILHPNSRTLSRSAVDKTNSRCANR